MKRCEDDSESVPSIEVAVVGDRTVVLSGTEAVMRYQLDCAIMALSVFVQTRPDTENDDVMDRLALGLTSTLLSDEHCLCPLHLLLEKIVDAYNGGRIEWEGDKLRVRLPTTQEREETIRRRKLKQIQREVVEGKEMDLIPPTEDSAKKDISKDGGGLYET